MVFNLGFRDPVGILRWLPKGLKNHRSYATYCMNSVAFFLRHGSTAHALCSRGCMTYKTIRKYRNIGSICCF